MVDRSFASSYSSVSSRWLSRLDGIVGLHERRDPLGRLLIARSEKSFNHEFLAHQRRARRSDAAGLDRQAVRNGRFIAGSAPLLSISGLLGVLLALTH
jgi:chorismate-pyruvate lyase